MTGWIPMRWPAGPLELSRRKDASGAREEILHGWTRPESLDLVAGTPVNCLVVRWAAGESGDAAQQKALGPLVEAAHGKGLAVVGEISGPGGGEAQASAAAAKLDAVLAAGDQAPGGVPAIPVAGRSDIPRQGPVPVLAIQGNVWPGISRQGGVDETSSGPTQAAWIESNAWYARLARSRAPEKTLWLFFDPPEGKEAVRPEAYTLALADAASAGARWVVSLDGLTGSALLKGSAEATAAWRGLSRAAAFFEKHAAWREHRPAGVLGLLSDFTGDNEFLAFELLNLLARRQLPYRIVEKGRLDGASLEGLRAVVSMDQGPPSGELRRRLDAFMQGGGLLVAGKGWPAEGVRGRLEHHPRFEILSAGRGRLAVSTEDSPDPYLLALDVHMLLSRANDLIRFFNVSAIGSALTAPPSREGALVQVLNFAGRPGGHPPVVWLAGRYKTGRVWLLEKEEATPAPLAPEMQGVALHLPDIRTYAAVEAEA